jgi:hypothetical protein
LNELNQTGSYIADDSTGTYIKVTNMGGHFHLFIRSGADRVAELSGNYPTAQAACRRASYLRTQLVNGATVQQLIDQHAANQTSVLAEADRVIAGIDAQERTADEIRDAINVDGAAYHAAEVAEHNRVVQIRDEVMAAANPNWRATLRTQVVQAAKQANQATLAQTVPAREGRTVRNTRTHVFRRPLDPAQIRAIRAHRDGIVYAGNGISWLTLRAIVDKNYGTASCLPGRQIILSVRLNAAGIAVATTTNGVAA